MILNVEHKLNYGQLGISRVQQPEGFWFLIHRPAVSSLPPGGDGNSAITGVDLGWLYGIGYVCC